MMAITADVADICHGRLILLSTTCPSRMPVMWLMQKSVDFQSRFVNYERSAFWIFSY